MENQDFVDQRAAAVAQFFREHAMQLARQGTVVASFRGRSGRRLGPYYRLTCRAADGRQVSVYLGPEGPLVAAARRRLAALREPLRRRRQWSSMRQAIRHELQAARGRLADELSSLGLAGKGAEIRGWRQRGSRFGQ